MLDRCPVGEDPDMPASHGSSVLPGIFLLFSSQLALSFSTITVPQLCKSSHISGSFVLIQASLI